jgi:hypothetical protein
MRMPMTKSRLILGGDKTTAKMNEAEDSTRWSTEKVPL